MLTLQLLFLVVASCNTDVQQVEKLDSTIIKYYVDTNDKDECVPHGKWIEYNSNGSIRIRASFHYGNPNGKWKYYRRNGKIEKRITYNKKGVEHGLATYWYANGQKWQEGFYCSGELCGEWIQWWKTGIIKSKVVWQSGRINGRILSYYPNGQLAAFGNMNMDERIGEWIWMDNTGTITKEEIFDK